MTVSVVFAIAGVIAILFGIVGGGIKAKEIEIPSLPTKVRIITTIIGVILISITLWLEYSNNVKFSLTPTATLVASSVTVTPTEILQIPSATSTVQRILFQENFSSNNLGWKEGGFSDRYAEMKNEFINGRLRRTAIGNGDFIERTWVPNLTLKDFRISVDVIVVDAPDDAFVCLGLRRSSDNDNYYHIYFGVNGTFGVKLAKSGDWKTIHETTLPNEIKIEEGTPNNLNITVQGSKITIVVNDRELIVIDDSGLIEPGNIGLGVGISDEHEVAETVIVEFDNLMIWQTP